MNRTPQNLPNADPRPVTLPNDHGAPVGITAALMAEDIHFSTASGTLTVEKLYRCDDGKLAYGVISASADARDRRAYLLEEQGECIVAECCGRGLELPVNDLYEMLAMALQDEHARTALDEHMLARPAVNQD